MERHIYFARQLVNERMREAEDAIPPGYGRPEIGPITSGLGEIFQFVVRGEGKSQMELKEVLDWYIAPQLRSVPGVVEVNSFGGETKQYQVVVDPQRLQASGLSLREIAEALSKSSANAGGGYIERNREQLVIGTEGLVRDAKDLESVVVGATAQGVPITIANVADVRLGPALRRGAASMDAKGEVAVGVVMMLMNENARTVTEGVKAKIAEISPTLPPGVRIEPFYDRAALVERTLHTVAKNLLEGAALVILVLLVLLGDLRAGLIVAITIPLSMLFAVILMNVFGVSGNLMSLGAIDFGLIVDGAVIIVENALRRLSKARVERGTALTSAERLEVVRDAAIEVRSASVFGEAIMAIVYLPILALRGMEGKLFVPMATTVLFALLGAFVLSLTLIPVLSSLLLRAKPGHEDTWLMRKAEWLYRPALRGALRKWGLTLGAGAALLALGVLAFLRLGAEFVPQLDEGDILVEARRLPGIALSESIATDARMQRAILTVPEVAHVVSKTGAPDLATDPMGLEQTDVYIQLKPRSEWASGREKSDVAQDISEVLEREVPEVAGGLSQPIEMRTNELVAGVKSDVAVQIYGPDLEELQRLADRVGEAVRSVPGAADVRVEQGSGITYLRIRPDRARLARYGLTLEDVNQLTEATAVGHAVGQVFEQDRRFDIVLKFEQTSVQSIEALASIPLKSATGQMVPLADVAAISIEPGPAVVNRDKLSRRRTVEFNARGRDVGSIVADAQRAVASRVQLPTGYRIEWGGQFEHFLSARLTLLWVVPSALALILFMLWLAFRAMRPALLIFLNIPFAAVGGVLALWIRDIPFSISAGVGFIALFGVAVMNGLVLVSFARQEEARGISPLEARSGTRLCCDFARC